MQPLDAIFRKIMDIPHTRGHPQQEQNDLLVNIFEKVKMLRWNLVILNG